MQGQPPNWISLAIMAIVVPTILYFRFRSLARERALRPERLWILPAIYGLFAIGFFTAMPPHGLGWLYAAIALLFGLALGWQRGKLMRITVHPETGTLNQKASPAAMIFILALIAFRMGSKMFIGSTGAGGLHGSALVVTDALIAMALGFIAAQRVEMYLRAMRLLAMPLPVGRPSSGGAD